jgi:hypothetical protein
MVFSVPTQVIFPQFKDLPSGVRQTISPDHVLLHARVGRQRVTHMNWPRQPLFTFRKQFRQILARVTPPAQIMGNLFSKGIRKTIDRRSGYHYHLEQGRFYSPESASRRVIAV